jgi:formamidopyrimidine-DNA glycosylase
MPELPEVETTCRGLERALAGARIERVEQRRADLRFPMPKHLELILTGRRIAKIWRRAKYIVIELDDGQAMLLHLGMSGRLVIGVPDTPPEKHDHVIWHCDGNRTLRFNDPRRFGMLDVLPVADLPQHRLLRGLGVEPLQQSMKKADYSVIATGSCETPQPSVGAGELTVAYLTEKLRGKKTPMKAALLDQAIIAGLGNIYVCEALFYAGISPLRRAGSLKSAAIAALIPAIRKVLNAALKAGGSSLRDYVQSDGALGFFQNQFAVYDREDKPCPGCTCGKAAIKRIAQSGRSTFYCAVKQK